MTISHAVAKGVNFHLTRSPFAAVAVLKAGISAGMMSACRAAAAKFRGAVRPTQSEPVLVQNWGWAWNDRTYHKILVYTPVVNTCVTPVFYCYCLRRVQHGRHRGTARAGGFAAASALAAMGLFQAVADLC